MKSMKSIVKAIILCVLAVTSMAFNSFAAEANTITENERVSDLASYELMIGCVARSKFCSYQTKEVPRIDGYSQVEVTCEYTNTTDNRISIYDAVKISLLYDNQYVYNASEYLFAADADYIEPHSKEGFCVYIMVPDNVVRQSGKIKLSIFAMGTEYSYSGEVHDYASPTSHGDGRVSAPENGWNPSVIGGVGTGVDLETELIFGTITEFHNPGIVWTAGIVNGITGEQNMIFHWVFPNGGVVDEMRYCFKNNQSFQVGRYSGNMGYGNGSVSVSLAATGETLAVYNYTVK